MAWSTDLDVDEAVLYNNNSPEVILNPGEGAHVSVGRADVGPTGIMAVKILSSASASTDPEGLTLDNTLSPYAQRRVGATAGPASIIVMGCRAFVVRIERVSGSATMLGDVKIRKNGINFD